MGSLNLQLLSKQILRLPLRAGQGDEEADSRPSEERIRAAEEERRMQTQVLLQFNSCTLDINAVAGFGRITSNLIGPARQKHHDCVLSWQGQNMGKMLMLICQQC